jgi:hypothetical protein
MPSPAVHLPIDFERREAVRLLCRKISVNDDRLCKGFALAIALRVWLDWASKGVDFRPLYRQQADPQNPDWSREDLTYVIEGAAAWDGNSGDLIRYSIDAGFLRVEKRGEQYGFVLADFYPLNEHLSPNFESIQSRGGRARAAKRYQEEAETMARQRRKTFEAQRILPFGSAETTQEEQEACYALFIRLHRVCDLPVPSADKFSERAMSDTLDVIRNFTRAEIDSVESWLLENRDSPAVVKDPERIIEQFAARLDVAAKP